jgi:hypothetical protein
MRYQECNVVLSGLLLLSSNNFGRDWMKNTIDSVLEISGAEVGGCGCCLDGRVQGVSDDYTEDSWDIETMCNKLLSGKIH